MKNFNYLYNKYIKSGYELYYGTWSIIDPNIISVINEYGSYEPRLIRDQDITDNSLEKIERIILSSDLSHNETYVSKQLFGGNANIKYDEKLGYYLGLYIGFVKELDYRKNGSSGGFGTWILTELLNKGLIDGVIHVKENDNKEKLFEYTISNNQDEVIEGASTKYYPVELSEILRKVKGQPGKYAIVGTPAVIMGIRLLSEEDPIIKDRIKYTIGLVCGHHKSTKFAEFLAWQCGIEPGNLKKINFRKKIENSNSNDYAMEAIGEIDNVEEVVSKKMSTLYGHDWGKGLFKEISSDYTDDVMNETADITLGDAWLPQYTIDSMGNNILIVRNKDINDIILEGIELKRLKLDITDAEMINKSQSAHYRHTRDEL